MYHFIVEKKLRATFDKLNQGNAQPMIDSLASRFTYRFEGINAIGGVRNTRQSMTAWWARIYRLFPGMQFEVRDVVVAGPPWRTRIHTYLDFTLPAENGVQYRNTVAQVIHMEWGKVTRIHSMEDTERATRKLAQMAQQGNVEAAAAPITDMPWPSAV